MIESPEKINAFANPFDELVSIIGESNLSVSVENPLDFITAASGGIGAGVINRFVDYFGITRRQTAAFFNMSEQTLAKRIRQDKPLEKNDAVQLLELTHLFLFGSAVLENKENFIGWLYEQNMTLGGLAPAELLSVPEGISKVRDILGRIEHGVFS